MDFFEVWVELAGVRQKSWLFLMRLMHSGRDFAMLCAQQDTTWFLAAHVAAFTHFAGGRRGGHYLRQPDRRGRQGPGRRSARSAAALRSARGALRVRASILPSRRRARQGRGRAPRRTHSMAAPGAAAGKGGSMLAEMSTALQRRLDAQHDRDASRADSWARERAALRVLPLPFDGRQRFPCAVKLRHHATTAIAGGIYSVPSRWCGQTIDVFVGVDTVIPDHQPQGRPDGKLFQQALRSVHRACLDHRILDVVIA